MGNIAEYCNILGVKPGDSPEMIKKAFREQIKSCHPDRARAEGVEMEDRARKLIEAYNALRDGVPHEPTGQSSGNTAYAYRTAREYYQRYRSPGEDIFRSVFGNGGEKLMEKLREALKNDPDLLRQFGIDPNLYRAAKGTAPDAQNQRSGPKPGRPPQRPSIDHANDRAKAEYLDADDFLKDVVRRYTRMKQHRAKRPWARDYIRDLNQVLILFRSIARRNPSISSAALFRVKEVQELINQVRSMIH